MGFELEDKAPREPKESKAIGDNPELSERSGHLLSGNNPHKTSNANRSNLTKIAELYVPALTITVQDTPGSSTVGGSRLSKNDEAKVQNLIGNKSVSFTDNLTREHKVLTSSYLFNLELAHRNGARLAGSQWKQLNWAVYNTDPLNLKEQLQLLCSSHLLEVNRQGNVILDAHLAESGANSGVSLPDSMKQFSPDERDYYALRYLQARQHLMDVGQIPRETPDAVARALPIGSMDRAIEKAGKDRLRTTNPAASAENIENNVVTKSLSAHKPNEKVAPKSAEGTKSQSPIAQAKPVAEESHKTDDSSISGLGAMTWAAGFGLSASVGASAYGLRNYMVRRGHAAFMQEVNDQYRISGGPEADYRQDLLLRERVYEQVYRDREGRLSQHAREYYANRANDFRLPTQEQWQRTRDPIHSSAGGAGTADTPVDTATSSSGSRTSTRLENVRKSLSNAFSNMMARVKRPAFLHGRQRAAVDERDIDIDLTGSHSATEDLHPVEDPPLVSEDLHRTGDDLHSGRENPHPAGEDPHRTGEDLHPSEDLPPVSEDLPPVSEDLPPLLEEEPVLFKPAPNRFSIDSSGNINFYREGKAFPIAKKDLNTFRSHMLQEAQKELKRAERKGTDVERIEELRREVKSIPKYTEAQLIAEFRSRARARGFADGQRFTMKELTAKGGTILGGMIIIDALLKDNE